MPRTIGIRELKARASEVIREVQTTGAGIPVTSRGRPVARIEPVTEEQDTVPVDGMGGLMGSLAGIYTAEWEDFQELKRLWDPRPLDP